MRLLNLVLSVCAASVVLATSSASFAALYLGRSFRPQVLYNQELSHSPTAKQTAYLNILNQIHLVTGAKAAIPVADDNYNVYLHGTNDYPYVPMSVYLKALQTRACDLNTVGACIVLEKDTVLGKTTLSGYYLGGADHGYGPNTGYGVVRLDIDKNLQPEVRTLLADEPTGVFIFSQGSTPKDTQELAQQISNTPPAGVSPQPAAASQPAWSVKPTDPNYTAAEKEFESETAFIRANWQRQAKPKAMNLPFDICWLKAKMQTQRLFFIADILSTYKDQNGVEQVRATKQSIPNPVSKTGPQNNQLFCRLQDGTLQFPRVAVYEYQILRIGLAFSHSVQDLFATGVGFADGAVDILKIADFGYIAKADLDLFVGGVSLTPLVLSRSYDDNNKPIGAGPVFSFTVSGGLGWRFLNANATLGGWYKITLDPQDT